MKRPSVEHIMRPLKPFQRRTVDHAFHRLFLADDSTSRFLVADEVGLGKTLVARGIIARTIDHLWEAVNRIHVVYICSNAGIARANLPKLTIGDGEGGSYASATRLTMLATELAPRHGSTGVLERKLSFVSFTPSTSFKLGHQSGQRREREVLFRLLHPVIQRWIPLANLLQAGVTRKDDWRWGLKHRDLPTEPGIRARFIESFQADEGLRRGLHDALDRWFFRYRHAWPREARRTRDKLIGQLRLLLASICLKELQPALIVLDEFQRFKPLLETNPDRQSEAARLAQALFRITAHDGRPVRTLLLSATPYKPYTSDAEIDQEDHYKDFLDTTEFLFGDRTERIATLTKDLRRFARSLKQAASLGSAPADQGALRAARAAKSNVEHLLQAVMARTERVAASGDRDAMVAAPDVPTSIRASDVRQYFAADALFQAVGDRDPMPFWKSAPYLAHFMRGYKVNQRLDNAIAHAPEKVRAVLRQHGESFLDGSALRHWTAIDPAHGKLREMVKTHLDRDGLWRLLWLPPTVPYWPSEGAYADADGATKSLMFSAWNVVPDVVSGVLSYEAERRMAGGRIDKYENPDAQQRPLLRFTQPADGRRSRHRLLLLLLPCLRLADDAHPLGAPLRADRRQWVRERVRALLSGLPDPPDGPIDDRWEWAIPLLLDPGLRGFLEQWRKGMLLDLRDRDPLAKPNPEVFDSYLQDLLELDADRLGRRPPHLAELVTEAALGSPAVLATRAFGAFSDGVTDTTRRRVAVAVAGAFWSLFNRPAVISMLRHSATQQDATGDDAAYWRLVLEYCRDGNLQAVLDEQLHLLWDQHSWGPEAHPKATAKRCARWLVQGISPVRARVHARLFSISDPIESPFRVRTVFALRFGHLRGEDGVGHISQDAVRIAFNSPFRPFVLTSTSIGQEGLDFHPWCHRLIHWNLPGNPVDLEQREGRVHRYKGHAVRKNVAAAHSETALARWSPGDNLWSLIFHEAVQAARAAHRSDLVPHWIAEGPCRVERRVPLLPYTSEVAALKLLKRQLAAYRLVFGQPRQEELMNLIVNAEMPIDEIQALTINLAPPTADQGGSP
ncbi:MAG: DEAD/DEAH box helicase [Gemmatimonadetes bacterium]|nr:DEAD/DEAH box helicase [Gemmatimonadota bacterium]MYG34161.1 DEAD/DEAH box helicase [Gemmatimonadota bacterium]